MRVVLVAISAIGACVIACGSSNGAGDDPDASTEPILALTDISGQSPDLAAYPYGGAPGWDHADKYAPGVALADFDGDGILDLAQPRNDRANPARRSLRLYRGLGDGRFEHAPQQVPWNDADNALAVVAFDYDADDDVDLFVAIDGGPSKLYRNDGEWNLVERAAEAGAALVGVRAFSAAPGDFDGDGFIDLYIGAWNASAADHGDGTSPNILLRNKGDGTFVDVTESAGVECYGWATLGAAFADLDDDGDLDLFVANDYFDACLYQNHGDGTFSDVASAAGVLHGAFNGMGVAVADLDGDDDLDIVVTDDEVIDDSRGNAVYLNRGGGLSFDSAAIDLGLDGITALSADWLVCWGVGLVDFDLDGDIDVHVTTHGERRELVWQQMSSTFVPRRVLMRDMLDVDGRGSAYGDIDGDGDADIVIGRRGDGLQILRNDSPAGGAWVAVDAPPGTVIRGAGQLRTIPAGDGYLSSSPGRITLAIGDATETALELRLPGGRVEHRTVSAGTTARVR